MPQVHRRIILIPPDLGDAARDDLERRLKVAFEFQAKLSRESPHVLRPFGSLTRTDQYFYFDHEPAVPVDFKFFFDRESEGIATDELFAAAFALVDALRAAQSSGGSAVHGGLAPGVLLRTKEGPWKVADFRVAPALCDVLGIQHYLNLSVGPKKSEDAGVVVSGAWEVLEEYEYERDDRLCAFVDPEKYAAVLEHGERVLATFEPGSDVVAAGNLIALLAQRIHPFLGDVPEAHRIVDMSRMMASTVAMPLRRADLVASSDAAVKGFADLLTRMLDRQPRNRPRPGDVADSLVPIYASKQDYANLSKAQDHHEAEHWIASIEPLFAKREWLGLERALAAQPPLNNWPDAVTARIAEIRKQLQEYGEAEKKQAQLEADRKSALQWAELVTAAVQAGDWEAGRAVLHKKPELTYWPADVVKTLEPLKATLVKELKSIDDHAVARKWHAEFVQCMEREDWLAAEKRLTEKPALDHWPEEITRQLPDAEKKIREQLGAIRSEHQKAAAWIEQAREAVRSNAFARAFEILHARPDIQHWPAGVQEQAEKLIDECADRIGDDAALKLQLHDESVERAARAYVRAVIEKDLAGYLDPGGVKVSIDGDQVTSEENLDLGHAVLVFSIPGAQDPKQPQESRVPFEYDLTEKANAVRDPDGQCRKQIVQELAVILHRRQSAGPTELNAKLAKSLFPQTRVNVKVEKLAKAAKARALLDGDETTGFDVNLKWDPQRLSWFLADAVVLGEKIASHALRGAREWLLAHCLQNAPALAPYTAALELEVDSPTLSSNALAGTAPFTAALSLTLADGRKTRLQDVKGEMAAQGRIDLFGDWAQAVNSLSELLVAEQTARRDEASAAFEAKAAGQGAKVKIAVTPKRLKSPTPEISIEVRIKGGETTTHVGRWNPIAFRYDFGGSAIPAKPATPHPVQVPSPKPAVAPAPPPPKPIPPVDPPKAPVAEKPKPAHQKKEPKPEKVPTPVKQPVETKSASSRKALIGGGIAAVIAIAALVAFMIPSKKPTPKPQPEPDPTPEPPAVVSASPQTLLSLADAEFAAGFTQVVKLLDGAEPPNVEATPVQPWDSTTPDQAKGTIRIPVGSAAIEAECTLTFDPAGRTWSAPAWQLAGSPPLEQIADWLRGRAAKRIQTLANEGKREEAESLYSSITPHFSEMRAKVAGAEWPPLDELIATEVKRLPPAPAEEYTLTEILGVENAGLAKLIQAVIGTGRRSEMTIKPKFDDEPWNLSSPQSATRTAMLPLKDYPPLRVSCEFAYDEASATYGATPTWTVVTPIEEQLALARSLIEDGEKRIRRLSSTGKLNSARQNLEQFIPAVVQLQSTSGFSDLAVPKVDVPPSWEEAMPEGYEVVEAVGVDESTGYARQIRSPSDGRLMLLVALSPTDPLWDTLGRAGGSRDWFILYVDAREWAAAPTNGGDSTMSQSFNTFEAAASAAAAAGVEIPTLEQWTTAAAYLTSRSVSEVTNLYDGLFEWCRDEGESGTHRVTGGCHLNTKYGVPAPPSSNDLSQRLEWLQGPLITQSRSHGDELVGLRTVKVIYPFPPA